MTTAPAGKRYSAQQVHIFRLRAGKIAEYRAVRDDLGLPLQLGVIVPPRPAPQASDSLEEMNKDLVQRHYETIFSQKQLDRLAELISPDLVLHHSAGTLQPGLERIKEQQFTTSGACHDDHRHLSPSGYPACRSGGKVVCRGYRAIGRTSHLGGKLSQTATVIDSSRDPIASRRLDDLLQAAQIAIEPVTKDRAQIDREAYRDFGKGSGHPAQWNFGDCFAYALAKQMGEPLLFKGDDFAHTDVTRAPDRAAE